MRILITRPAAAFDAQTGAPVADAERLGKLQGLPFDEAQCAEYIEGGPLADLDIQGGKIRLAYDPADGLTVTTEYQAPRKLKPGELKQLVRFTEGQWSDGIGEGEFLHRAAVGLDVDLWPSGAKAKTTAEQLDDGARVERRRPSPLIKALEKGEPEKLLGLIAKGADVNARGKWGVTPLHVACARGQFSAAELLLAHGADVKARHEEGWTPLASLAMSNQRNHEATHRLASALLDAGADANARDKEGRTPLMWAANRGETGVLEALAARGAQLDAQDKSGRTPLMYCQRVATAEILLRLGADPALRNEQGKDAAEHALRNDHWDDSEKLAETFRAFPAK